LHTPGHTPGSISLVVEPETEGRGRAQASAQREQLAQPHADLPETARLLAGDTLFQGSIGRTDLWGGSYPQILSSIREKLLTLPDDVAVYPGHGDVTTIGTERAHNPFLR
jgi:glyoxylase-like metal-dependent hydrolase (beta-lactamase superfamily II)